MVLHHRSVCRVLALGGDLYYLASHRPRRVEHQGCEPPTEHAARIEAPDLRSGGAPRACRAPKTPHRMPVDDRPRTIPAIGPERTARDRARVPLVKGQLLPTLVHVPESESCTVRLFLESLAWKETRVYGHEPESEIQQGGKPGEELPVGGPELLMLPLALMAERSHRVNVTRFGLASECVLPIPKVRLFVVAENALGPDLPRESHTTDRIGTTIEQVAQEHEAVSLPPIRAALEQESELIDAAMDVAYDDRAVLEEGRTGHGRVSQVESRYRRANRSVRSRIIGAPRRSSSVRQAGVR